MRPHATVIGTLLVLLTYGAVHDSPSTAGQQPAAPPESVPENEAAIAPPTPPVAAEETLQWFQKPPHQTIELVAAEPQVIDPVALTFDDRGDLWVVEMSDYPSGPPTPGAAPLGRIRILHDQDLDGRFETARTFADQLSFATGLQLWQDGAIVTAGGQLLFLRDTNGDGEADRTEVWFDGLAEQNPQLRANHPSLALDNWLYVANGLRSATVIDRTAAAAGQEPRQLELSGRDLRIDLLGTPSGKASAAEGGLLSGEGMRAEAVTGPSQFGLTWDRFGHRYFCSNRNPCVEVAIEQRDAALSPLAGIAPLTRDVVPAGEASQVHPLVQAWTTSNLHAGQFTAACGVLVSSTEQLPAAPLGHALVCEPTGHLVHRRTLAREAARTQVADEPLEREWLASFDNWFRPVNLSEGPDGAIYVADMYRAVIEHPDWVPEELKNRPDARYGDDRGRVYRVGRLDGDASREIFHSLREQPLRERSPESLVALLDAPHEWLRATAARLLLERRTPQPAAALKRLATSSAAPAGRLRAAWMLLSWHALDDDVLRNLLGDADPRLRAAGWQLAHQQPQESARWRGSAIAALGSSDLDEALAAAWYLAGSVAAADRHESAADGAARQRRIDAAVKLATRHAGDPYVLMAATAACRDAVDLWYERWLGELSVSTVACGTATWEAAERLGKRTADPSAAGARVDEQLLRFATQAAAGEPADRTVDARAQRLWLAVALGRAEGNGRKALAEAKPLWTWASQTAVRPDAPRENRLAAIRLLGFAPQTLVPELFPSLPEKLTDSELAGAAITAWSRHADDGSAAWMIKRFSSATPRERTAIFDALVSRPDAVRALVETLEAGELAVRDFDASQIQRLGGTRVPELKGRIAKLLQGAVDPNRAAVLERYAAALSDDRDPRPGAALFEKHCAACHHVDGVGHHVGPDISDSRTQQPLQLLTAVLDPNRAIDNRYFRYLALTEDGRVIDGVLAEETSETVTLMRQNAERVVVPRDQILELKPAGVSLMPEGLEAQMSPAEMAQLISYIKNWRYLKDNIEGIAPPAK